MPTLWVVEAISAHFCCIGFQLFGDTMNTTSRVEATGAAGKIHVSDATAVLLQRDGKASWLKQRDDGVSLKGKGHMNTYWIVDEALQDPNDSAGYVVAGERGAANTEMEREKKKERLVDWNVSVLLPILKKVM